MNRTTGFIFEGIRAAISVYRATTKEAMVKYAAAQKKEKEKAARYKDEDAEYQRAMVPIKAQTKAAILEAGKQLSKDLRHNAKQLKENLMDHLTEPLNQDFARKLDFYNKYNVIPTRLEIDALLQTNGGNTSGVRALTALLDRLEAPQRLKMRDISEFETDLEKLERLAYQVEHTPLISLNDFHDALEIFKGDRLTSIRKDGSTYEDGRTIDFMALNWIRVDFETFENSLDQMKDTWQADISTEIEDAVDAQLLAKETRHEEAVAEIENREPVPQERPESSTVITEDGDAVKLARDQGRQSAGVSKEARAAVLSEYAK